MAAFSAAPHEADRQGLALPRRRFGRAEPGPALVAALAAVSALALAWLPGDAAAQAAQAAHVGQVELLPATAATEAPADRTPPPATAATPNSATVADPTLLAALGGDAGLRRITAALVDRAAADPLIGHHFKDVKPAHLKAQLADHLCQLLGGGCVYDGETMKASHEALKVSKADFNRLVLLLQQVLDAHQLPFGTQNRLLAVLAPMHRDIIAR